MLKRIAAMLLAFLMLLTLCSCAKEKQKEKFTAYYFDWFDTATTIIGYEYNKSDFDAVCNEIKAMMDEYHKLFDIYTRYDGVNNLVTVNDVKNGEHAVVTVDARLIDLIEYSKQMYTLTDGNMNIAMGSVLSIWHNYRSNGMRHPEQAELPPMDKLLAANEHTSIEDIIIDRDNSTVYLSDPEMSLDVGAIAKGYAVEMVASYLEEQGITGYLINAGGNIRTIGVRGDGTPWAVGIENPDTSDTEKPHIEYLHLSGQSLVTSGSYQRFYTVNGINYHHIIDPETLMPGEKYLSVSVICKSSAMGDAFSTALFNMDYEVGLEIVENNPDIEAMWVMPDGEQRYSSGFGEYTFEYE